MIILDQLHNYCHSTTKKQLNIIFTINYDSTDLVMQYVL